MGNKIYEFFWCEQNNPVVVTEEKKKIINENVLDNTKSTVSTDEDKEITIDDYYFGIPEENKYSDEALLGMKIERILFGIHPTLYKKDMSQKSFHPFFYLELNNEYVENFGVVVQYVKVPDDIKTKNQVHFYEEIEFIEKIYSDFENELKNIFNLAGIKEIFKGISEWIIKLSLDKSESESMTLKNFFEKTIEKNEYLQEFIMNKDNSKRKTCFDFCCNTIQRLEVKKKKKEALKTIKSNMEKALILAKGANFYDKYLEGFNEIFNLITEKIE